MTRRRFVGGVLGAAVAGTVIGTNVVRTGVAGASPGVNDVVPIPTTLNFFGEDLHVQIPPFTGEDTDPATVFDFAGTSAIASLNGDVVRRNRKTGEVRTLPYIQSDMRFMQGTYRNRNGQKKDATFVFI